MNQKKVKKAHLVKSLLKRIHHTVEQTDGEVRGRLCTMLIGSQLQTKERKDGRTCGKTHGETDILV